MIHHHHMLSHFTNYVGVGYQSNRILLNTSVLHGATAYLSSTTQILGNTMPLGKTCCQTFWFLTIRNDCQRSMNDSREQRLYVLSAAPDRHTTNFQSPGCYWEIPNWKTQYHLLPNLGIEPRIPRSSVALATMRLTEQFHSNTHSVKISSVYLLRFKRYSLVTWRWIDWRLRENNRVRFGPFEYITLKSALRLLVANKFHSMGVISKPNYHFNLSTEFFMFLIWPEASVS